MDETVSLLDLLGDRFGDIAPEARLQHVGRLAAKVWALGAEGLRVIGFLIPYSLHTELSDEAAALLEHEQGEEAFLARLREGLRFDDFLVAFLETLQRWATDLTPSGQTTAAVYASTRLSIGDALAQFVIQGPLGEGGMGRVYRAQQPTLERTVAIKVLHPHHAQDEIFLRRFEKEAQAAAKLSHPNVVEVYEAGSERGLHYIVFEFVDGRSLADLLYEHERLPETEALSIVTAVARALRCAEEHGYVHRDVKPSNILVGNDGVVKLSDLGLARRVEEDTRMTTAGLILGTPHFMAPEQAMDDAGIDIRADLYSLGLTLFQSLTGSLPFSGRTAVAVISQHVNQDLPSARGYSPEVDVSVETAALIRYLSDRKPERRYPTAAEAVAGFERVLEGLPPPRPSTLSAEEVELPPAPRRKSSYYTDTGQLLTGPSGDEPPPAEEVKAPEQGRLSLAQEWATVARSRLLELTEPRSRPDPVPTAAEVDQLLLSDDTQRAYRIVRRLGQGTQGVVYEVEVLGLREFRGFLQPLERAVMKRAKEPEAIRQERLIYSQIDYRLVKLLDHGASRSGRPYLILERLRGTPQERYRAPDRRRVAVDPATAVELFVNLLDRVKGLHFRRKLPVILCDIKPANVMLRMPTEAGGPLSDDEYLERLAAGRYEPVFVDLGCAQHRDVLRQAGGRLRGLVGSPVFLPPESIPSAAKQGLLNPGLYGPASDVYSLTLTFYEWLSGHRAYQHLEHEWTNADDPLLGLFQLKYDHVDPIDPAPLRARVGVHLQPVLDVLRAGLDPDPQQRATTNKLLELCKRAFKLEAWKREPRPYAFDDPRNHLAFRQGLFPRLDPARNGYRRATRVEPE